MNPSSKILILLLIFCCCVGVVYAVNGEMNDADASNEQGNVTSTSPPPKIENNVLGIFLIVFILATGVIMAPWLFHIYFGHKTRNILLEMIRSDEGDNKFFENFTEKDRLEVIRQLLAPLPERKGLTRFAMMGGVLIIIAIVVLFMLILTASGGGSDALTDILQNALAVLTGAFSAMIGFYFGGRAQAPDESKFPPSRPEPGQGQEDSSGKTGQ